MLTEEFIRSAIIDKCSAEMAGNANKIIGKTSEAASKTGRDRMLALLELLRLVDRTRELTIRMIATVDEGKS